MLPKQQPTMPRAALPSVRHAKSLMSNHHREARRIWRPWWKGSKGYLTSTSRKTVEASIYRARSYAHGRESKGRSGRRPRGRRKRRSWKRGGRFSRIDDHTRGALSRMRGPRSEAFARSWRPHTTCTFARIPNFRLHLWHCISPAFCILPLLTAPEYGSK